MYEFVIILLLATQRDELAAPRAPTPLHFPIVRHGSSPSQHCSLNSPSCFVRFYAQSFSSCPVCFLRGDSLHLFILDSAPFYTNLSIYLWIHNMAHCKCKSTTLMSHTQKYTHTYRGTLSVHRTGFPNKCLGPCGRSSGRYMLPVGNENTIGGWRNLNGWEVMLPPMDVCKSVCVCCGEEHFGCMCTGGCVCSHSTDKVQREYPAKYRLSVYPLMHAGDIPGKYASSHVPYAYTIHPCLRT